VLSTAYDSRGMSSNMTTLNIKTPNLNYENRTHKIQYIQAYVANIPSITSRYIMYQLANKGNNEVKKLLPNN
jgi:hypothetical protein